MYVMLYIDALAHSTCRTIERTPKKKTESHAARLEYVADWECCENILCSSCARSPSRQRASSR